MAAKRKTTQQPKASKAIVDALPAARVIAIAAQNLTNMIAISAVSGTVLLMLLIIERF
jgi:hypothetical protein